MTDIKDKTLLEKIQRVKIMLAIYGVFGFFFGIYVFVYYIYYLLYRSDTAIFGFPFAFTMTLSCIFGGLKEIDAAARLKDNILLGARDGIYGQLMITIPSAFFVFSVDDLDYKIGYLVLFIPIIWLLFNIILFFKLRLGLLKIIAQTKQNPSNK